MALLQATTPWAGLDLLVWLCQGHHWHASTGVHYLAAIQRALRGQPPTS